MFSADSSTARLLVEHSLVLMTVVDFTMENRVHSMTLDIIQHLYKELEEFLELFSSPFCFPQTLDKHTVDISFHSKVFSYFLPLVFFYFVIITGYFIFYMKCSPLVNGLLTSILHIFIWDSNIL